MDTTDDPVVDEISVFLSKGLEKKLYIFQYPLRPISAGYDNHNIIGCRIKPKNQQVELKIELNTSRNYDKSRGEVFADNANKSTSKSEESMFSGKYMDYQIYQSTRAVNDSSRYAVGMLQGSELHLNPVEAIVQLRPNFKYLDKSNDDNTGVEESEDNEEKIQVKFARRETDKMKQNREKSFSYLQKKTAEESWCNVTYHSKEDETSKFEQRKLLCSKCHEQVPFPISPIQYLRDVSGSKGLSSNPAKSLVRLRSLPIQDQTREFMIQANLIQFGTILRILQSDDALKLLKSIQQVALLVQGSWVVRSDLLYTRDKSNINGVPSELMHRGRDYVLFLFTQQRIVERKNILKITKLPIDEVTEILQPISNFIPRQGWEFALPFDNEFVQRYPEVVQRQKLLWEAKNQQLSQTLKNTEAQLSPPKVRRRNRSQILSESFSSDESGSETTRRRHNSTVSVNNTGARPKIKQKLLDST